MHDLDTVLVEGWGTCTRAQARAAVIERNLQTGQMLTENRLPIGFMELTAAYHAASASPGYSLYIAPIAAPWPTSFFD